MSCFTAETLCRLRIAASITSRSRSRCWELDEIVLSKVIVVFKIISRVGAGAGRGGGEGDHGILIVMSLGVSKM